MRRFVLLTIFSLILCGTAMGQTAEVGGQTGTVEDHALAGKSVFAVLSQPGSNVTVNQDASISSAMSGHVNSNRSRSLGGYRVRIFFDNKQNSRGESEAALRRFQGAFPGVPAYRSFTNPFFKVTVGDFRTKSEATQLLNSLKGLFPNAFVVKENINYPAVDRNGVYVIDTLKVNGSAPEASL